MVTDIHFHIAGVECDEHMFISETMKRGKYFRLYRNYIGFKMGVAPSKVSNNTVLDYVLKTVDTSTRVDKCVLLAFDWVYTNGQKDESQSHMRVSNKMVADIVRRRPNRLLFGASVNPNRDKALEELKKVADMGAVLIKLIPSAQNIELEDHKRFFEEMAALRLPLLCHCGVEHGIPCFGTGEENTKQRLNDTNKIIVALEAGVKVVVAHCALPIDNDDGISNYEKLKELMSNPRYDNFLFADLSAFFIPFNGYRREVVYNACADLIEKHDRLILGSDFPILSLPLLAGYGQNMTIKEYINILGEENILDRNVLATTTRQLFNQCVLENADKVLRYS